jgi:hypothetical protein
LSFSIACNKKWAILGLTSRPSWRWFRTTNWRICTSFLPWCCNSSRFIIIFSRSAIFRLTVIFKVLCYLSPTDTLSSTRYSFLSFLLMMFFLMNLTFKEPPCCQVRHIVRARCGVWCCSAQHGPRAAAHRQIRVRSLIRRCVWFVTKTNSFEMGRAIDGLIDWLIDWSIECLFVYLIGFACSIFLRSYPSHHFSSRLHFWFFDHSQLLCEAAVRYDRAGPSLARQVSVFEDANAWIVIFLSC